MFYEAIALDCVRRHTPITFAKLMACYRKSVTGEIDWVEMYNRMNELESLGIIKINVDELGRWNTIEIVEILPEVKRKWRTK